MLLKRYYIITYIVLLLLATWPVLSVAGEVIIAAPRVDTVDLSFSGGDIVKWSQRKVDEQIWRVSTTISGPVKAEFNFHRVTADFSGSGILEVSVGYSASSDVDEMIEKKHLHSRFQRVESGKEVMITSRYKGQRFAWVIVRMSGRVAIKGIKYSCRQSRNTLYGHVGGFFRYGGGKLPYRLMYPNNYDRTKLYPLVISVAGSGSVGADNSKNMEMIILARYLYTHFYHDKGVECFSLVPQIPRDKDIGKGFWPRGDRGKPTMYHPDWAGVNAGGWFAEASLNLIKELAVSSDVSIDVDRVYMTGFSYGGKACWEFLRSEPGLFAAVASGGGWPIGRAYSRPEGVFLEQLRREVSLFKGVPAMIFAGGDDKMRFGSAAVNKEIIAQGGKTRFIVYEGAGHVASAGKGWGDIENIRWLFRQKR